MNWKIINWKKGKNMFRKSCENLDDNVVLTRFFLIFCIIQSITIFILCTIALRGVGYISSLYEVDLTTLLIAIVILSIILLVVGVSSALTGHWSIWFIFQVFMFVLLLVEIIVCLFSSQLISYPQKFEDKWNDTYNTSSKDDDYLLLLQLQNDLDCCGLYNNTDRNITSCDSTSKSCLQVLTNVVYTIRNSSSVCMFVCFMLGLFISFVGFAICFKNEDNVIIDSSERQSNYDNPFSMEST